MGYRRGAGRGAVGAWLGRWVSTGLAMLLLAAAPAVQMRAEARLRPLDHHAVVFNGTIVGSAFAIEDGVAVTNRHVVAGLRRGEAVALVASGRDAGAEGRLVAVSPRMDLAVLAVPPGFLPTVPSENAPERAGLPVTAAGIDAGDGRPGPRFEVDGTVLDPRARIAAFGPGLIARLPAARPGFSGGPLFDRQGRFAGMVTAIRPAAGSAVGAAGRPARAHAASVDAFALRAAEVRAEVRRLLAAYGG
jgi:S1-C subfamily serine protease